MKTKLVSLPLVAGAVLICICLLDLLLVVRRDRFGVRSNQELIDKSQVLVNGVRIALNLQLVE